MKNPRMKMLTTLTAGFVILAAMLVTVQTYLSSPRQKVPETETKAVVADRGYIHMDPSGKGFVYDDGTPFIPNGFNGSHMWAKNSETVPREMIKGTMTYDEFFSLLKQAGINFIRLRLDHGSIIAQGMDRGIGETPPLGRYDISDRVSQSSLDLVGPRDPDLTTRIAKSNLTELIQAAEKYGIKLHISFFSSTPPGRWRYHAYNRQAHYVWGNKSQVPPAEAGPLDNYLDFFVSPTVLETNFAGVVDPWAARGVSRGQVLGKADAEYITAYYQKQYIDFVMDHWGESPAIAGWEVMVEMQYVPDWVGHWSEYEGVAERYVSWVIAIGDYIRNRDSHNRPVTFSDLILRGSSKYLLVLNQDKTTVTKVNWDGSVSTLLWADLFTYDRYLALNNYAFWFSDLLSYHNYDFFTLSDRTTLFRNVRKAFANKALHIGEFWDVKIPETTYEYPPFAGSKQQLWINLIASGGQTTAARYPWRARADNTTDPNTFVMFYLNEPWYYPIYSPTSKLIEVVNWDDWRNRWHENRPWENDVVSNDLTFRVAQGNPKQVMLMFQATTNNPTIMLNSLTPGSYKVWMFNYLTGEAVQQTINTSGSSLTLVADVSQTQLNRVGVIYVEHLSPTLTSTPTRTLTPIRTPTSTRTPTASPTRTPTPTPTPTPTTPPIGGGPTATRTAMPTRTPTPSSTRTPSPTRTLTPTPSPSSGPSASPTPSRTPTPPLVAASPTPLPTWTTGERYQLLVGDVNDSNTITIEDVSAVLAKYTDFSVPVPPNTPEDVNADGTITIEDVALVLLNYIDFTVRGEGP